MCFLFVIPYQVCAYAHIYKAVGNMKRFPVTDGCFLTTRLGYYLEEAEMLGSRDWKF